MFELLRTQGIFDRGQGSPTVQAAFPFQADLLASVIASASGEQVAGSSVSVKPLFSWRCQPFWLLRILA